MISDLASRSLSDFQVNARTYIKSVNETKEPILLTIDGEIEAVIVDPATLREFEETMEQARFIAAIKEGEEDVAAGRTKPAKQALDEIRA